MIIGPPKESSKSAVYLLVAISESEGMVGYQILTALPTSAQQLLDKLHTKFPDQTISVILPPCLSFDDAKVVSDTSIIVLPTQRLNEKFNSAKGIWQLLAKIYETVPESNDSLPNRLAKVLTQAQNE